jgi:hypothetical protein
MRPWRIALIAATAVALVLAARAFWPSEERRIRSRLDELASVASERGGDGLERMARAARLGQFFTPEVVIDLGAPFPELKGRETIVALWAKAGAGTDEFGVRLADVRVEVNADGTTATSRLTAILSDSTPRLLADTADARELQLELTRQAGYWQVARVVGIEAITRPR